MRHLAQLAQLAGKAAGYGCVGGLLGFTVVKGVEAHNDYSVDSIKQRTFITADQFLEQQESFGVPARQITSDMTFDILQAMGACTGQQGPSSYGSQPIGAGADALLKLGVNTQGLTKTGALSDPYGAEHLVTDSNSSDSLATYFGRVRTFLQQAKGRLQQGDTFVSYNAGSLNANHNTNDSSKFIGDIASSTPGHVMGHTVKAETGIADYAKSWWGGRINSNRRGYDVALLAGVYTNLLVKMQNPGVRTVNINHSWGGPSTIQNYAYALAAFERSAGRNGIPRSIPLPIDHVVCVDPRCITGPTQAKALAAQIAFLRSRGVKVDVVKDSAKTNGFGMVDGVSSLKYIEAGSADVFGGVEVDHVITTNVGHAIAWHEDPIRYLLD